jgi:hypothetical protein
MKKLDVLISTLIFLGFIILFSVMTANIDLFMWSVGIEQVILLSVVMSSKFRKWLSINNEGKDYLL